MVTTLPVPTTVDPAPNTFVRDMVTKIVTTLRTHGDSYKQAHGAMKEKDAFCALGLYYDVNYVQSGLYTWQALMNEPEYCYLQNADGASKLPLYVEAETKEQTRAVSKIEREIIHMNDHKKMSYAQIADKLLHFHELGLFDTEEYPARPYSETL